MFLFLIFHTLSLYQDTQFKLQNVLCCNEVGGAALGLPGGGARLDLGLLGK